MILPQKLTLPDSGNQDVSGTGNLGQILGT
jgi:hypothetical protein